MHLYFQVHLFIPCSLATRNKVMLVSEKHGLPPGTLNPYGEWPCGRWFYESPEHLQPGLRSFMNNLGHTCTLPPTVSGSPGTHQVLCTAPSSEDTAPHVVLSLKNAWFPLLSHSLSSSFTLPLLLLIFVSFHSWRNILCGINISPKGALIYHCVMGSWQLRFHSTRLFCWPLFIRPLVGPCWRRQWQPTPVLLPGKSHGWRSLVGCSPWGRTESDTTEAT